MQTSFWHFTSGLNVGPVYLESMTFFVLLEQTILERELRQAPSRHGRPSLSVYPDGRDCRRGTTRRFLDLFNDVQCYTLTLPSGDAKISLTELSPVQHHVLRLLGIAAKTYGR